MKCKECGSHAINRHLHGRDGSDLDLCDVCYWRKRANAIQRPGCVATAHWGACDTCRYNDSKYGCVIKEKYRYRSKTQNSLSVMSTRVDEHI